MPLYLRPPFLVLPSLLTLVLAGGWLGLRRAQAGERDDARARGRRLSKEATRVLKQMEVAATTGDAARFFVHARTALQNDLAARWQLAPDEVTAASVAARLDGNGSGNGNGEDLSQIFALADEASYAGRPMTSTDFARWTRIVRDQLAVAAPA